MMWCHNGYTDLHRQIVMGQPPRMTIRLIAEYVAREHGVAIADILSDSRIRRVTRARQEVMRRAVEAGFSLGRVGRFLGRDHTTVLHGVNAARARIAG